MNLIDRFIRVNHTAVIALLVGFVLAASAIGQTPSAALAEAYARGDWKTVIQLFETAPGAVGDNRLLALAYYHQLQLDQALPLLQQLVESNPADDEINRALLNSLIADRAFSKAKTVLAQITAAQNSTGHISDYQIYAARIAVGQADQVVADSLYQALLQIDDPSLVQEVAAEYVQYLQQSGRYKQAYDVAQQAIRVAPDSFLSYRLRQVNEVSEKPAKNPWSFTLGYRLEYDDNVALLPDGSASAASEDQEDLRHVVTADAVYQKQLGGNWLLFAEGRGTQSVHHQASEFNFTRLNGLLGTGQSFDGWGWRLPAEISHNRFDGDSFSTTFTVSPGAYVRVSDSLYTHVYARYASSDFDLVAFPEDDRSAEIYGGGALFGGNLTQRWTLRSIVEYLDYDADGSNWDRQEIQAYTYTEYNFTPTWSVGAGARYTDIDFDNLNVPFLAERADQSWEYYLSSTLQVFQGWYLRSQLTFVDNQSTLEAFDYQRLVASVGISWRF